MIFHNLVFVSQCEEEDRIEAEKTAAHEAWLKEREVKKQAIQAALKAHSAKVPLKGAAALAVQQSGARRASSQSQGESSGTSDVDSPLPAGSHLGPPDASQGGSSRSPRPESGSPLLTSLLQSPSSMQPISASGDMASIKAGSSARATSDLHSSPIVVVDSPNQQLKHSLVAGDSTADDEIKHMGKKFFIRTCLNLNYNRIIYIV